MNCSQCNEPVEPDAKFCGNCGLRLVASAVNTPQAQTESLATAQVPGYAQASPVQQQARSQSLTALLLGVLSIPASVIALLGLVLAVSGIVIAASARSTLNKKTMNNVALGFAVIGVVVSVGSAAFGFLYTAEQKTADAQKTSEAKSVGVGAADAQGDTESVIAKPDKVVDTPCFRIKIPASLGTVENLANNCNVQARDDETFGRSSRLLAVSAAANAQVTIANLPTSAQKIIGNNAGLLLGGYTIVSERTTTFAGSPAYMVEASSIEDDSIVQLIVVLHGSNHGENIFVIGTTADKQDEANVMDFQEGWEWK